MEILRGMEVKITGVIHRLIFFLKKKINFFLFFFFYFFFGGGGGIFVQITGGHGPPPPPIPSALKAKRYNVNLMNKIQSEPRHFVYL